MELGDRIAASMTVAPDEAWSAKVRWRFRLAVSCLMLTAFAFVQSPGRQVSDTKYDLIVDPAQMLARALHMWDPSGGFGQVQNQAYGYLFPMGTFFWVGDLMALPPWVIQRLWWTLLLSVAFLGVVKLAGAMDLGTPSSRILAGFAYALSPRILTTIGPISIEAWPMAVAPWVLVPLVIGAQRGSPRRAAALSALAVASVGGVNAAATLAVIPLGVLWLVTRTTGPRRRAMMWWWPGLVALGTVWWLVPLFLLGRFSPPFLDFIESSSITTIPTNLFDVLRGASHWVPYVDATWRAGNDIVTTPYIVVDTVVLLALGLIGLSLHSNAHNRFLVLSMLVGVGLVSMGHTGQVEGWFASAVQSMLDGTLAPLRNVHKFDPVIRLPLVLGLAHLIAVMTPAPEGDPAAKQPWRARLADAQQSAYLGVLTLSIVAIAGVATPVLTSRLAPAGDFVSMPDYWRSAAAWLGKEVEDDADPSTTLLLPGSSFAYYLWGMPEDEPLQALGLSGWAVRNAVPLAPAGNVRMLNAVEDRLASGQPSVGLSGYLRRAGVRRIVVRNDLLPSDDVPDPALVHQALLGSPGFEKVAQFGPRMPSAAFDVRTGYRAIEIFEVAAVDAAVVAQDPPVIVGGPEDLLNLMDAELLGAEPTLLAMDAADDSSGQLLLTDGLRRREATFARVHRGLSATLTAGEGGQRKASSREYVMPGQQDWETTAEILGAKRLSASGSRANADTIGPVAPGTLPFAAFDGQIDTSWESGLPRGTERPWLKVDLDSPLDVDEVTVVAGESADSKVRRIVVETAAGTSAPHEVREGRTTTVAVPDGATSWFRVSLAPGSEPRADLSISEVRIDGLDIDRTLVLPRVPADWGAPQHVLLTTEPVIEPCVRVEKSVRCTARRPLLGESGAVIDRTVRIGTGADYAMTLAVRPRASDALTGLITRGQFIDVKASSTEVEDPRASALAMIDGDRGTTWLGAKNDEHPILRFNWIGEREVSAINLSLDARVPAARPSRIQITYPAGKQTVALDRSGNAQLEPFTATEVAIKVLATKGEMVQVGVSEVRLPGVDLLPIKLPEVESAIGCGFGPTMRIGSQIYATSITASPRQLFDSDVVPGRVCGPASLDIEPGETRVVVAPAPAFLPVRLVMSQPEATPATAVPGRAQLIDESVTSRTVTFERTQGESLLNLRQNINHGWHADTTDGRSAAAQVVDGWQQGWWVPSGLDSLELNFTVDRVYRLALILGAAALLLLLLISAVSWRTQSQLPGLESGIPGWVVPFTAMATIGLVGGWGGLACGLAGAVVACWARTRIGAESMVVVSVIPLAAASSLYWLRPLGSAEGWAGALATPPLLASVTLGALFVADLGQLKLTSLKRIKGRSTPR